MKLSELPVFFLDLQTTGARPEGSRILEMGWASLEPGSSECHLVLQPEPIPRRIQMITGISNDDMDAFGKPIEEVAVRFSEFLKSLGSQRPHSVIHFAQFERPFLDALYADLGAERPFEILCTHEIAKRLMPNLPTRGIKGLAGYFGYAIEDAKRSSCHVQGTQMIWLGLLKSLEEKGVNTLDDLNAWLTETPKAKRTKYEYPLAKEKRLGLPNQPGIYRMVSLSGEVLYVGKATSLRDRVNSYFRGQKNRDPRKLEMLTQVWDLRVTPVGSPLEAALLETDEIKRLNPRYNVSLKTGNREMAFYSHDFSSVSRHQDEIHDVGPFSNAYVLESVRRLSDSLRTGVGSEADIISAAQFDRFMFFEEFEPELLREGFRIFCERHALNASKLISVRCILATGLKLYRKQVRTLEERAEVESHEADAEAGVETEASETAETEGIEELTAEDLADKFERHFMRASRAYRRARHLTRLLDADIEFECSPKVKHSWIRTRGGHLLLEDSKDATPSKDKLRWKDHLIDTYDRMTVLNAELDRVRVQGGEVHIHPLRITEAKV